MRDYDQTKAEAFEALVPHEGQVFSYNRVEGADVLVIDYTRSKVVYYKYGHWRGGWSLVKWWVLLNARILTRGIP